MPKSEISAAKRKRIHERDNYQCWYCGKQLPQMATCAPGRLVVLGADVATAPTVDHLDPRVRGGYDLDNNLVTACRSCNSQKGKKTVEEYRDYLAAKQDKCAGALRHIAAAISEAPVPYDAELRRIAAWMQGETVTVTFWGERKDDHVQNQRLARAL